MIVAIAPSVRHFGKCPFPATSNAIHTGTQSPRYLIIKVCPAAGLKSLPSHYPREVIAHCAFQGMGLPAVYATFVLSCLDQSYITCSHHKKKQMLSNSESRKGSRFMNLVHTAMSTL